MSQEGFKAPSSPNGGIAQGKELACAPLIPGPVGIFHPGAEASPPSSPFPPLQKKLQDQRQRILAAFEQGHQFLWEREQHLLDQLAKLEQEVTEGREKYKTRGDGELARLAQVISELEGKAQQPAAELMQVRDCPGAGSRETRRQVLVLPLTFGTLESHFLAGPQFSHLEHGDDNPCPHHLLQGLHEHTVR